jgi:hypothetical protein
MVARGSFVAIRYFIAMVLRTMCANEQIVGR